ncbi:hypothetical protein Cni_G24270 [Canna indica]|uniref:Uncharacterized protein n=1 Tax=Canna indica TaxID=4628 RepID=A0AAQ3KVE1_9LILI|nr:hypothetical protein Cni_G24270 [Canna indica]
MIPPAFGAYKVSGLTKRNGGAQRKTFFDLGLQEEVEDEKTRRAVRRGRTWRRRLHEGS